jgi:hypothetical protein
MERIDWINDRELLDSKLLNLQGVILYLLSTGRNAWHSTWSERYRRDAALFSNLDSAKAAAEISRNRGTTFEIEQYPGLAFFSAAGIVALVEFHSKQSFSKLKIEDIGERLKVGTPLRDAIAPFNEATNEFWNTPFPSESSFVDVKSELAEEFEPLINHPYLKKWGSVASGSNYYLGWNEKSKPEETPITRILGEFTYQNLLIDFEECEKELASARLESIKKRQRREEAQTKLNEASIYLSSILAEHNSLTDQNEGEQEDA